MPDIFQSIDHLDKESFQRVVDRLEFRGSYTPFVRMREAYLDAIALAADARVLDLGCGTGVVSRAIAARPGFTGEVVGTDLSAALVQEAERRAQAEGLKNLRYAVADSGAPQEPAASYDAVIAHTLVSHAAEPQRVLNEAARLVRRDGVVVVFDGDYASLVCHTGDPSADQKVMGAMTTTVVGNPYVMRELPGLLLSADLRMADARGDVLLEAGRADFFASLVEAYVPLTTKAGVLDQADADGWLDRFRSACKNGSFFGACNYVTYIAAPAG